MMLIRTSTESWNAEYTVQGNRDAQIVRIKSRSSITVTCLYITARPVQQWKKVRVTWKARRCR